jgi:hypothetical protein
VQLQADEAALEASTQPASIAICTVMSLTWQAQAWSHQDNYKATSGQVASRMQHPSPAIGVE